jgi:hypothetical protein
MNLRRSLAAKAAVSVTAASLLLASGGAALAQEESPSPEATPEETPEETTAEPETTDAEEGGHKSGPNTPLDNTFALGQAMQLRVNADAEPNSGLANFRWTVSQLTVQGPPDGSQDGDYTIPVPEGGALPRYLNKFGTIDVENGEGQWEVSVENGFANARSVSLFPQDDEPAISLEAEFTLDGEPVTAQEIVGESGVVTATYTLTNNTTSPTEVTVNDLGGNPVTTTVEADVPLVAIAKTLLPYRFVGLNTGSGIQGSDGRGNNQVQWIALPFRPLSGDGTATFGWSAHVEDGLIPSMLIQVAVLHIPAHEDDPNTPQDESAPNGSESPVNLEPAVAEIQSGLANIIGGIEQLTSGGGEDPLQALSASLTEFFQSFGSNLQSVAQNLDPNNPEGATALLKQAQTAINQLVDTGALDAITQASDVLTPERAQSIQDAIPLIQNIAANAPALVTGINAGCLPGPAQILPDEVCDNKATLIGILQSDELQSVAATLGALDGSIVPIANGLDLLAAQLPGVVTVLQPLLNGLVPTMEDLSGQIQIIAAGLEGTQVDLGTLDQVIASVLDAVFSSPGGQQLSSGFAQLKGGVGLAGAEISAFAAEAIAALRGGVDTANQVVVNLKGGIAGLLAKSAESPLIYGPLPENTPENTVLAGAYEFRVDAADTNLPYTLPRILVGLLALIAGGLLVKFVGGRASA